MGFRHKDSPATLGARHEKVIRKAGRNCFAMDGFTLYVLSSFFLSTMDRYSKMKPARAPAFQWPFPVVSVLHRTRLYIDAVCFGNIPHIRVIGS